MIRYVKGDATRPIGDGHKYILHVCNNEGGWGRGFVKALSVRWKGPEKLYREWAKTGRVGDKWLVPFELGRIQWIDVEDDITVINMVAQNGYAGPDNSHPLDLAALERCLATTASNLTNWPYCWTKENPSAHMPRIGTGLAAGSWDEVEPLILKTLVRSNVPVVVYDL